MSIANYDHIDPTSVRKDLASQRQRSVQFEQAWQYATRNCRRAAPEILRFMEKHFRAAYYNHDAAEGRCNVPERDVSHAVGTPVEHPTVIPGRGRCRSGDGCERRAERGRFGAYWCSHHADELEHLTVKLKLDVDRANPRKT